MVEYLRGLGIGLISLLGVAIPGSLLIMLITFGLIIPVVCITTDLMDASSQIKQLLSLFSISATIWVFATLSYVVGYILRLTSPNELDKNSAIRRGRKNKFKKAALNFLVWIMTWIRITLYAVTSKIKIKSCSGKEKNKFGKAILNFLVRTTTWIRITLYAVAEKIRNYRGKKNNNKSRVGFTGTNSDRFPYNGLKKYLVEAGHHELLYLVTWGQDATDFDPKCDNSHINKWKNDIELYCPKLSAAVDSEEAHIRLMSGTWLAIRTAWPMVLVGLLLVIAAFGLFSPTFGVPDMFRALSPKSQYYLAQACLNIVMLLSMWWSKRKIEELFHPRRVGELLLVLHAKYHADIEAEKQKNLS